MNIETTRETLLPVLTQVGGVVERRQTLPILANILIKNRNNELEITATDLEVELKTLIEVNSEGDAEFTLPARKLLDICKALPDGAIIKICIDGERAVLKSGKSRFSLGLLPAQDFPSIESTVSTEILTVEEGLLKKLIANTYFAMAQQDVRYYLNGLLLEVQEGVIRTVATDGHRLAVSEKQLNDIGNISFQVILPRKAVLELTRLLEPTQRSIKMELSSSHLRVFIGYTVFTTKLIDGKFPDYRRVVPKKEGQPMIVEKGFLKSALVRASILSNEKYKGIRFRIFKDTLELQAHNPEQEEAQEELEVDYNGKEINIGFNVGYILDVLTAIESEKVEVRIKDANSSALITGQGNEDNRYVVMPMRL